MSAKTSIGQQQASAKDVEGDPAHVQKEREGREQPSDNVGQWLALEAKRVKATSPGVDSGNISYTGRDGRASHCRYSTANSKQAAAEGPPKGHPIEPILTNGTVSTETHKSQHSKDHSEDPSASERSDQARDSHETQGPRGGPSDAVDRLGSPKYDCRISEPKVLIFQPELEVENLESGWAIRSVSERSMPSTELVSHSQEEPCCDNTNSDLAICGLDSWRFDSSISRSGSEISFQRYPASFDTALQGLGTQFERSLPVSCSLESLTLPTKDEARYISERFASAYGRLLSSLSRSAGSQFIACISYVESRNGDASEEYPNSKKRAGSQVPHDASHDDENLEDLDDMEEDGVWHKLPFQQRKSVQQSQPPSGSTSFLVSLYLGGRNWRKGS